LRISSRETPAKGLLHRGDLGEDVGAVAVLLDHLVETADLAFDPLEAVEVPLLEITVDCHCFLALVIGPAAAGSLGLVHCSSPLLEGRIVVS
jgi:hypothetical protein